MKKYYVSAAVLGAVLLAVNAKSNDPVLMTVNGKDVPLSEFEYLYHKNNSQQLQPQSLDEYVDMFVNYKLKVADAEAAGLDTTAEFRQELAKYSNDLAKPYLRDNALEDSLAKASYQHMKETVTVSHIMLPLGNTPEQLDQNYTTLDSLRRLIVSGNQRFEDAARQYSIDRPSQQRDGLMGAVTPGRYPWTFEDMAYNTPVGSVSPVVNSGFGLHLIRVEKREPAKGEVHAAHILRLTRDVPEDQWPAVEATIDSLYKIVSAPGVDFSEVASRESQDPGSARRGGDLGWFSSGMMVQPFDSISFALADGEISKPFKTSFGYHIIKRYEHRGVAPYEEMHDQILKQMQQDQRGAMPEKRRLQQLAKQYRAQLMHSAIEQYATNHDKNLPAFVVDGKVTKVSEIAATLSPEINQANHEVFAQALQQAAQADMDEQLLELARHKLMEDNADYRNLTNEYRDGILMFEISNRKVWDRASKDTEGLNNFFAANRGKYNFDSPKYKAVVVFANTDSVMNVAREYAAGLGDAAPAEIAEKLKEHFGRDIKVERVIAAKGENAITDYLGFGAEKPTGNSQRWNNYFAVAGKIIEAPEEAADVKGLVTTDYQAQLEKEWLEAIHKKYKVKVNKKVLKEVK